MSDAVIVAAVRSAIGKKKGALANTRADDLLALVLQQLTGERESHPLIWSVLMLLCFMQKHRQRESLPQIDFRAVA